MIDEEVAALLDSPYPLVVVEAPAGCGKTFQGANYARRVAEKAHRGRALILTHTHSACTQFAKETRTAANRVEIRTIDSLVVQIATAYHKTLDLPPDPSAWARQLKKDGFQELGARVAQLLAGKRMIAAALADRYPVVIADEHQDASGQQHEIITKLHEAGSHLRVFGDPMQAIYDKSASATAKNRARWETLKSTGSSAELQHPHRWRDGSPQLGQWILRARETLRAGNRIDLSESLPSGLKVLIAENIAVKNSGYRLSKDDRKPIDDAVVATQTMLVLSGQNSTVEALRAFWNRRFPIWEGHTREALGSLVTDVPASEGNAAAIAEALVLFLQDVCVGFSRSDYGDRLVAEVASRCAKRATGKRAYIQELARYILTEPNHFGVAKGLRRFLELVDGSVPDFDCVHVNYRSELRDAIRLGEFSDPEEGLAQINRHRSFARPIPPRKAISTIHKAKGLECEDALVIPCDGRHFSDTAYSRCKLYVAMSRAKRSLTLVLSRTSPSPLFILPRGSVIDDDRLREADSEPIADGAGDDVE